MRRSIRPVFLLLASLALVTSTVGVRAAGAAGTVGGTGAASVYVDDLTWT